MELRQLKYFIKAAALQNFTDAAGALYITQSTLSQQIKQLEDELNIPLFDRIGKRVRLTEAGKLFLPYAQKTATDAEDGRNILNDLMNLQTGTLTIGATYGLTHLLTKAIVDFSVQCPDIKIQIKFGTTQDLLTELENGKIDIMLSFFPVQQTKSFIAEKLFSSCLSLIVHNSHPLSKKKLIDIKQIEKLPLLLPADGYSIRNYLDTVFEKHQISADIKMEVNDINTLLQLVDTGKWVTILMSSSIFNYQHLKPVKITGEGMSRDATITWSAGSYRKKATILMAEQLKKYAVDNHFNFNKG